jgi:hypothetical protein
MKNFKLIVCSNYSLRKLLIRKLVLRLSADAKRRRIEACVSILIESLFRVSRHPTASHKPLGTLGDDLREAID